MAVGARRPVGHLPRSVVTAPLARRSEVPPAFRQWSARVARLGLRSTRRYEQSRACASRRGEIWTGPFRAGALTAMPAHDPRPATPTCVMQDRRTPDDAGEHLAAPAGTTRRNAIG